MYNLKCFILLPSVLTTSHLPQVPSVSPILMRLPSVVTIVRTFYTFTNATRLQVPQRALSPFVRGTAIRSMPTIPFLGSLFSSSSSSANMTYPDQRNDQEWQAVLNKGGNPSSILSAYPHADLWWQNNSESSGKKAPNLRVLVNTTNICPTQVFTHAPVAMRLSTKQITNSSLAAAGQHTLTPFPVQS